MSVEAKEETRYARQLLLPAFAEGGQEKLRDASVLVVGAGGLGSPVLLYLAGAGVGRLELIDDDTVAVSNLHRQPLHTLQDVGKPKSASAEGKLRARAGDLVSVRSHQRRLTPDLARRMFPDFDLVVDASDNFETRYLVSDTAAEVGVPVVWGAVLGFDAQVSVFAGGLTLRDVHPAPPHVEGGSPPGQESPSGQPAVGPLVGQAGSIMAMEALKVLGHFGDPLIGRLLVIDAYNARFYELPVVKRP